MKRLSVTTDLQLEIVPFIIDLGSPCSTAQSTPTSETDLATLPPSSHCPLTLFEILVSDLLSPEPTPASRAAILYYLPRSPVVQRDISTFVPALLNDTDIMTTLATNIGYYHAHEFISDTELEYLLTRILVCGDEEGKVYQNLDSRVHQLYHFTKRQVEQYGNIVVPTRKLHEVKTHQRKLKKNTRHHEKNWRRKCEVARSTMPKEWHVPSDIPLPYGCSTYADVFTEVNEMFTLLGPSSLDRAQARSSSYPSFGLELRRPRVKVPDINTDQRALMMTEAMLAAPDYEDQGFSTTRALLESLHVRSSEGIADVAVMMPHVDDLTL
ncbi:hypothetical protein N0V95_001303 [Ascochyta clinopodiicola]|nr:hypothetical protein N0V95_001303 [Ascochyta clinopodiicola]